MPDYSKITNDEFDRTLAIILNGMNGEQILAISGVYEVVAEELNNRTLDKAMAMFHSAR